MVQGGEEDGLRAQPGGVGVFFGQRDEFFGEALRFFGFGPGGCYGLVGEEGGYQVAEEGLPVRGVAVQVPVFHGAAGHGVGVLGGGRGGGWGGGWCGVWGVVGLVVRKVVAIGA